MLTLCRTSASIQCNCLICLANHAASCTSHGHGRQRVVRCQTHQAKPVLVVSSFSRCTILSATLIDSILVICLNNVDYNCQLTLAQQHVGIAAIRAKTIRPQRLSQSPHRMHHLQASQSLLYTDYGT
ncbi:hypothetical protein VFPPC_15327 [Pochonia chlamydosporia 170]|uniref:Uncharacterized protein n=1 Tax=Pochonia chlamydosporia 170 TaxID=1380566 RepID=A0A179G8T4_METCM|nr:hypothetical protein VFPPC_15327 [Pochonia chlamydosporia 170]OAQ73579.1 hypothetical protein VFPPC_15327 [Pochonia chlamydosporia 170]